MLDLILIVGKMMMGWVGLSVPPEVLLLKTNGRRKASVCRMGKMGLVVGVGPAMDGYEGRVGR